MENLAAANPGVHYLLGQKMKFFGARKKRPGWRNLGLQPKVQIGDLQVDWYYADSEENLSAREDSIQRGYVGYQDACGWGG